MNGIKIKQNNTGPTLVQTLPLLKCLYFSSYNVLVFESIWGKDNIARFFFLNAFLNG